MIAAPPRRIDAIDTLRAIVMVLMLVDHAREFFYLPYQVDDPMRLDATPLALAATRLTSHVCAPVFVLLTGLGAWLSADRRGETRARTARHLVERGLVLIALELTVVTIAWRFEWPPSRVYLQVIWAIGLSMIALAALIALPRAARIAIGLALVGGHALLDPITIGPGQPGHVIWAILHDRQWLTVGDTLQVRTSYPVLPWIGVMVLGHAMGPWYASATAAATRRRRLVGWGLASALTFVTLRAMNAYGDQPWAVGESAAATVIAFLNLTKYPPSPLFLAATLAIGLLALAALERMRPWSPLTAIGQVPLFFYVVHLYVLHGLYHVALAVLGPSLDARLVLPGVWAIWALAAIVGIALMPACRAYARYKRHAGAGWTRY